MGDAHPPQAKRRRLAECVWADGDATVADVLRVGPPDVWLEIVLRLDLRSVGAMSAVNRAWHRFCNDRAVRVSLSLHHLRRGLSPLCSLRRDFATDIDHHFHLLAMTRDLGALHIGAYTGWCYLSRTLSADHTFRLRWKEITRTIAMLPYSIGQFFVSLYGVEASHQWNTAENWRAHQDVLGGRRVSFSAGGGGGGDGDDHHHADFLGIFGRWHQLPTAAAAAAAQPNSFTDEERRAFRRLITFGSSTCRHWLAYVHAFREALLLPHGRCGPSCGPCGLCQGPCGELESVRFCVREMHDCLCRLASDVDDITSSDAPANDDDDGGCIG